MRILTSCVTVISNSHLLGYLYFEKCRESVCEGISGGGGLCFVLLVVVFTIGTRMSLRTLKTWAGAQRETACLAHGKISSLSHSPVLKAEL